MGNGYHTVVQGECLHTIAEKHGFRNTKAISEHDNNSELMEQRSDINCLHPGDNVFIPEKNKETIKINGRKKIKIVIPAPAIWFTLILKDSDANIMSNVEYTLSIGKEEFQGKTDSDGLIKHQYQEIVKYADLELFPEKNNPEEMIPLRLELAHLDPGEEMSGIQGRLKNMGYYVGEIDGETGPATEFAIRQFQSENTIEVTGQPCEQTIDKLSEIYG